MKVVILAGGLGTRICEESMYKPKPMIEIGGMPIIWHIMKEYSHYGHNEFIICAGYRQEFIKEWFSNYFLRNSDVSFDYRDGRNDMTVLKSKLEPWKVTVVDTGHFTMTGGRVKRIKELVGDEAFLLTYGDGVCDVDINKVIEYHHAQGKIATLTAVRISELKGVLNVSGDGSVKSFREKSYKDTRMINAGYMVLEPAIFDYIDGDSTSLEVEPMARLAADGQLVSYIHNGFWQCMDTMNEKLMLEQMISNGNAPWIKWK